MRLMPSRRSSTGRCARSPSNCQTPRGSKRFRCHCRTRQGCLSLQHRNSTFGLLQEQSCVLVLHSAIRCARTQSSSLELRGRLQHFLQRMMSVLDQCARFLRKGSLSLTIRELGHMGLPERALQTLCWARRQKTMLLFPDDWVLASTVEVLARFGQLKVESALEQCVPTASRAILKAMASGFIRSGKVDLARKLLELARTNNRTVHSSIYVKLMLEATQTPEGYRLASAVVDELSERPDLVQRLQDCTTVMKVCIMLRQYTAVESLFSWFRESSRSPTMVMYTMVTHSRCRDGRHREALSLVWEMEQAGCLLDLPAYRVIVKLCVALHDPDRGLHYLSRLKEAGFVSNDDMYDNLIVGYVADRRLAKCRQLVREAKSAGVKLDMRLLLRLSEIRGRHCS